MTTTVVLVALGVVWVTASVISIALCVTAARSDRVLRRIMADERRRQRRSRGNGGLPA